MPNTEPHLTRHGVSGRETRKKLHKTTRKICAKRNETPKNLPSNYTNFGVVSPTTDGVRAPSTFSASP